MQVLCMVSNDEQADIVCPTCGKGYAVYYSRQSAPERESALLAVEAALAKHHAARPTADAHPSDCFNVPEWAGPAHMSGAALLSGAPIARTAWRRAASPDLLAS